MKFTAKLLPGSPIQKSEDSLGAVVLKMATTTSSNTTKVLEFVLEEGDFHLIRA